MSVSKRLSVVIPVYNTARYLTICLDSVLRQGMAPEEMEVILVNDGSTDNSEEICRRYIDSHPEFFSLVNKTNGGLSSARNAGLSVAKGEYVHFFDSDDYIADGSYRYLFDNFLDGDHPDFLGFSSVTLDRKAMSWFIETNDPTGKIVFRGDTNDFYSSGRLLWSVCISLYNRNFLNNYNLWFNEDRIIAEDTLFNLHFLLCNPRIVITDCLVYRYVDHEGSITKQRSPAMMRRGIEVYMDIFTTASDAIRTHPRYADGLKDFAHRQMVPFISRVLSSDISSGEFRELMERLRGFGLLPVSGSGKLMRGVDFITSHPSLFPFERMLYKKIFLPHILPRLSRN